MHGMSSMESYGAAETLHGPGLGSPDLPWLACSGVQLCLTSVHVHVRNSLANREMHSPVLFHC